MSSEVIEKIEKDKLIDNYFGFYLDNISDEYLRRKVIQAFHKSPDYFWTKSSAAEKAPADENKHAMLRRVAKTAYYVKTLLPAWEMEEYKDQMIAASLVHDCCKYETSPKLHGPKTAEWLRSLWQPPLSEKQEFVLEVVRLHDGRKWSGMRDLPMMGQRLRPEKLGAWLLHTCVVISSRTKTVFEWI